MIKVAFSYETLSYKRPVPVRGKVISENLFLKATVLEEDYFLSTLPHFHQATLQEIAFKVHHFFENYTLDFTNIDFTKKLFNMATLDFVLEGLHSETLFNIESILLGIISKTHPHLIPHTPVLVNELYRPDTPLDAYKDTQCLKIKIAPKEERKILSLIKELHAINPSMKFRLDGNRQFEIEELIHLYETLEKGLSSQAFLQIDYLEEPLKNFYETFLFQKRAKINIAIDESFQSLVQSNKLFSPIVIKPSLIGISPVISLLRSRQDLRFIISSSFEHPTIMRGLYFLSSERPSEFHGLENFIK